MILSSKPNYGGGPGYCPVWWYGKVYQISYSPFDLILRQGKFSQNCSVCDHVDMVRFLGMNRVRGYICICFRVPEKVQKIQDTIVQKKKKFLRKPSSNGSCLDFRKLSKEHMTSFIRNLSQDFISGIVWWVGMHFTSWTWEILCGSMTVVTWWLYLALRSL